jgi:hypothetical protein
MKFLFSMVVFAAIFAGMATVGVSAPLASDDEHALLQIDRSLLRVATDSVTLEDRLLDSNFS